MTFGSTQQAPLGDLLERLIDYRGKTPTKSASGVKLITAKVIKGGRIENGNHEFIAECDYDTWMRRGLPQQWDILITTEAPLGEVAMLRTPERIALAQRVILLRANEKIADQGYLYQALKSPLVQGRLYSRATGTTVLGIKQSELVKVEIPLPTLSTQRRIASILSAYDDLIENNTRRIAILEEMARRIYEEWFVRFRFPGHENVRMVESEVGLVPEGWVPVRLSTLAEVNARSIKRGAEPDEILYVDISSVSTTSIDQKQRIAFSEAPGRARRIVRDGDVIWACVRPNRKSFAAVIDPEPDLIVSTGFAVLSATEVPWPYLYCAVTTEDFVSYLVNHAKGAAYPAVSGEDFESASVLKPDEKILRAFGGIAEPMFRLAASLSRKNSNLRTTRDLLLPKLISGELDVSDLPEPETAAG